MSIYGCELNDKTLLSMKLFPQIIILLLSSINSDLQKLLICLSLILVIYVFNTPNMFSADFFFKNSTV